ncbi:MAG TPA: (2Fe-2S)-binding protein [Candidatus Cloacimonadota bacterium]|nr:(2Fe-2S)-binding protein [Candidatus Cloacimonadota bacterium]HQL14338.1 (2Fe-2S)-binding protein [Candidatus Cloacimonadota bacterium]
MKAIINKQSISLDSVAPERSLLDYLREELDLTGAKNGCGIGICGSCTILINNEPKRSCLLKVKDIIDKEVLTIEGLANPDGSLHPLQQAFMDCGAIQCGFCTPGMVLTAHAFLLKNPHPTRREARQAIQGNLCRCTGYQQIIDAILKASEYYR